MANSYEKNASDDVIRFHWSVFLSMKYYKINTMEEVCWFYTLFYDFCLYWQFWYVYNKQGMLKYAIQLISENFEFVPRNACLTVWHQRHPVRTQALTGVVWRWDTNVTTSTIVTATTMNYCVHNWENKMNLCVWFYLNSKAFTKIPFVFKIAFTRFSFETTNIISYFSLMNKHKKNKL